MNDFILGRDHILYFKPRAAWAAMSFFPGDCNFVSESLTTFSSRHYSQNVWPIGMEVAGRETSIH
jgi:hypothetical protein